MNTPPSGTIAFLFTDIEGSTRLWASEEAQVQLTLKQHDEIVRRPIEAHDGWVFSTAGDAFAAAFSRASDALNAARDAQQELGDSDWATSIPIKARMGLHVGEATERDGDYFGPTVNLAARVAAAGHGGQILATTQVSAPDSTEVLDLGEFRLRDVPDLVRVYQIGAGRFPGLRGVNPDRVTLPSTAPIIGRKEEVDRIRRLLVDNSLVTLTGVGGSGKTRLAIEVANQELPSRDAGVYFVDLSPFGSKNEVPSGVAAALRLQIRAGDPIEQIVDYLRDKNALVILDNCEHLIDAVADLTGAFLDQQGPARLLATSRELLDHPGELVVAVEPLGTKGPDAPAIQLFLTRAREMNVNVEGPKHLSAITELCTALDGMPLAIELAAARLTVLSPTELLARIDERFRLLTGGRRRGRTRTLEAAIDWSYDLLEPAEQRIFRHLGVFPGSFDIRAAASVCGIDEMAAVDQLSALAAKSMLVVERDGSKTRYRLLETLRAYALAKLNDLDESQAARDAHLDHFKPKGEPSTWPLVFDLKISHAKAADFNDLLGAIEWAAAHDRWDDAAAIAWDLANATTASAGFLEPAVRWLSKVIEQIPEGSLLQESLRTLRVNIAAYLDDWSFVAQEVTALSEASHPTVRVVATNLMSFIKWMLNDMTEAKALLSKAEMLEREEGPSGYANVIEWVRGSLAIGDGDFLAAEKAFADGVACDVGVEFSESEGHCAVSLAEMQALNGSPAKALDTLNRYDWSLLPLVSDGVVRTVARAGLEDDAGAREEALAFARTAVLGRYRRHSNDAVLALAVIALTEDPTAVCDMLMTAGIPRQPHTIALSLHLADRAGCRPEVEAMMSELRMSRERRDARDELAGYLKRFD